MLTRDDNFDEINYKSLQLIKGEFYLKKARNALEGPKPNYSVELPELSPSESSPLSENAHSMSGGMYRLYLFIDSAKTDLARKRTLHHRL